MGSTIRDAAKKAAESCDGGLHSYTAAEKACTSAGGRMDHMMHIVDSKADAGNTKNACTELKVSIQSGCLEGQYSNLISVASKCGTKVGVAERNGVPYWTCAD